MALHFFHSILMSCYEKWSVNLKTFSKQSSKNTHIDLNYSILFSTGLHGFSSQLRQCFKHNFRAVKLYLELSRTLNGRVSMKHVLACYITRTWSRYELFNYYKLNYVFKKVDWSPSQRIWGAYRYKTPVSCTSTVTSALNNLQFQSGKTTNHTGWLDRSMNDVVTGLLFLINSTYALLCEQQIEASSRRPLNRKKRKCVTDK